MGNVACRRGELLERVARETQSKRPQMGDDAARRTNVEVYDEVCR